MNRTIETHLSILCDKYRTDRESVAYSFKRTPCTIRQTLIWAWADIFNLPASEIGKIFPTYSSINVKRLTKYKVGQRLSNNDPKTIEILDTICQQELNMTKVSSDGNFYLSISSRKLSKYSLLERINTLLTLGRISTTDTTGTKQPSSGISNLTTAEKLKIQKAEYLTSLMSQQTQCSCYTSDAIRLTEENEYVTTKEECLLHFASICQAIGWGRECDYENKKRMKELRNLPNQVYISMID